MKINLLPQEYRPQAAVNFPRLIISIVFSISLLGLIGLIVNDWFALGQIKTQNEQIQNNLILYRNQYDNVKNLEKLYNDIVKKRNDIKTISQPFLNVKTVLAEFIKPLPSMLWLSKVNVDENNLITINGRSGRMGSIAVFLKDLGFSPIFKNIQINSIKEVKVNESSKIYEFEIIMNLVEGGKQSE